MLRATKRSHHKGARSGPTQPKQHQLGHMRGRCCAAQQSSLVFAAATLEGVQRSKSTRHSTPSLAQPFMSAIAHGRVRPAPTQGFGEWHDEKQLPRVRPRFAHAAAVAVSASSPGGPVRDAGREGRSRLGHPPRRGFRAARLAPLGIARPAHPRALHTFCAARAHRERRSRALPRVRASPVPHGSPCTDCRAALPRTRPNRASPQRALCRFMPLRTPDNRRRSPLDSPRAAPFRRRVGFCRHFPAARARGGPPGRTLSSLPCPLLAETRDNVNQADGD